MLVSTTLPLVTRTLNVMNHAIGACEPKEDHGNKPNWFIPTVLTGSVYKRLSGVTQSDHVNATNWSYRQTDIMCPAWDAKMYDIQSMALCKEFVSFDEFDGRSLVQLSENDVIADYHSFSKYEMDKVLAVSITKAQANLRKAIANVPMLYAERKASVKTITSYSKFILNNAITMQRKDVKQWLKAIRRRKRPEQLKRLANQIADRHLEFVFGVMPLIDDIVGLVEFIGSENRTFRTGRGNMTSVKSTSLTSKHPNGGMYDGSFSRSRVKTERHSVRTALRYDIDSSVLNNASLLGFNPIYAWYDLTPLSFLVGFFSNLNQWLQSLDGTPGLTFRTGYSTIRTTVSVADDIRPMSNVVNSGRTYKGVGSANYVGSGLIQNRIAYSSNPGVQRPYLLDNASFFAFAVGSSLTIQRFVNEAKREIRTKPFRYRGPKPKNLPPIKWRKP